MSDYSKSALEILRNPQLTMKWYLVPLFLILFFTVAVQVKKKNWNVLLGGAALWLTDLFNEIWNSIVFHATGFAPVWGTPSIPGVGETALLLLIGYNVEISIMFAFMGMAVCLLLPEDPHKKILGINNRVFFAILNSILAVCVECFLNYCGILTWEYPWWSRQNPYLIFLIGYLPFFVMAYWVFDLPTMKKKLTVVGSLLGLDVVLLIIFGCIGWM